MDPDDCDFCKLCAPCAGCSSGTVAATCCRSWRASCCVEASHVGQSVSCDHSSIFSGSLSGTPVHGSDRPTVLPPDCVGSFSAHGYAAVAGCADEEAWDHFCAAMDGGGAAAAGGREGPKGLPRARPRRRVGGAMLPLTWAEGAGVVKSGGGMSLIEMIALHFGSAPFTKNIMDPSMKYLNEQTISKSEFKSKANIVNRSSLNLILS